MQIVILLRDIFIQLGIEQPFLIANEGTEVTVLEDFGNGTVKVQKTAGGESFFVGSEDIQLI